MYGLYNRRHKEVVDDTTADLCLQAYYPWVFLDYADTRARSRSSGVQFPRIFTDAFQLEQRAQRKSCRFDISIQPQSADCCIRLMCDGRSSNGVREDSDIVPGDATLVCVCTAPDTCATAHQPHESGRLRSRCTLLVRFLPPPHWVVPASSPTQRRGLGPSCAGRICVRQRHQDLYRTARAKRAWQQPRR